MEAEEAEMRDEYDFSRGVRGRHAARFTAQARETLVRSAAAQDVSTWIAKCLSEVQTLELALFLYLYLALDNAPEVAGPQAVTVLEGRPSTHLGELVADLRLAGVDAGRLEQRFRALAHERSWLVHRSGYQSQAATSSEHGSLPLLQRLESLSEEASALRVELERLVEQELVHRGLSRSEISRRTSEAAERWLAA